MADVALAVLKKYWSFEKFRPLQAEIISAVMASKDTLALLPTGGGKSVCFQVPALCLDGLCLVISPLLALMKDQVQQLNEKGITAAAVHAGLQASDLLMTLDNAARGKYKFLYVSPERLQNREFRLRAQHLNISLVAVDEAHCISKWGHDFRPSYQKIQEFLEFIPGVKKIALTATATEKVQADIVEKLGFRDSKIFRSSFKRDNIQIKILVSPLKDLMCLKLLNESEGSALVYVKTRKMAISLAKFLIENNISADYYHAGLSTEQRNLRQDAWIKNQTRVIVATNAFGMGIDKPDVRVVIHTHLCDNLEAYYQEAGRAGRDGKMSQAYTIMGESDFYSIQKNFDLKYPSIDYLKKIYQHLSNYFSLPFGVEHEAPGIFDLNEFTSTFALQTLDTHYAILQLEKQGKIVLNEAFYHSSKIQILKSNFELEQIYAENTSVETTLKAILRIYGGEVFGHLISISEKEISSFMSLSLKKVIESLVSLHKIGIISYQAALEKPSIQFQGTREDANYLSLDLKLINDRKKSDLQALETIKHFVNTSTECRMVIIQKYFGELDAQACGNCDNCQKLNEQDLTHKDFQLFFSHLEDLLPISLPKLLKLETFKNETKLDIKLKYLMENGIIGLDSLGLLYKK